MLDARRASVAGGEPMSLYYPMSLQSLPDSMATTTRQMVGMTRSMSSSHATAGGLSAHGGHHHPYLDS